MVEVAGGEGFFGVAEDSGKLVFRSGFEQGVDLALGDGLAQLRGEVDGGDIDGGDAHGLGFEFSG